MLTNYPHHKTFMFRSFSSLLMILLYCASLVSMDAPQEAPLATTYLWGSSAMQGKRPYMEDTTTFKEIPNLPGNPAFAAVYDGHGGAKAAKFAQEQLAEYLEEKLASGAHILDALSESFTQIDAKIREKMVDGTTAAVAYLVGDKAYIAWVGDSRVLVIRQGIPIFATWDHTPSDQFEKIRIAQTGGSITHTDVPRIAGLAMSRSLGDRVHKDKQPAITAHPVIDMVSLQDGDTILLASDGVWEVITNGQAASLAHIVVKTPIEKLYGQLLTNPLLAHYSNEAENANCQAMALAARVIRNAAFGNGSRDNISVMVVQFRDLPKPKEKVMQPEAGQL